MTTPAHAHTAITRQPDAQQPHRANQAAPAKPGKPVDETSAQCSTLGRSPAAALRYALAILVVIGGPAAVVFLLGVPELALPSEWSDASARIDDGSLPAGYMVNIVSGVLAPTWIASLWFLVSGVRKQDESSCDETGVPITNQDSEPDEPWYRQGPPIFDEPFSDEYPRVVVPLDDMAPDDETHDSLWQPATMTADPGEPRGTLPRDATVEDMGSDAEIIGDARDPDEPPMIVPVRAYYFTRAEDTLRSISAQFLHTPKRWEELRSLNAASPGVAAVGPDTLLPAGTALALPGDPLPWGRPDPVCLWTLAEKFLFIAWGREPTPEEVVPFWRGLTSGTQPEAGTPAVRPESLAAPTRPPTPTEPPAAEIAREPAPTEPPAPGLGMEPSTAPTEFQPAPRVTPSAHESPVPPTHEPGRLDAADPMEESLTQSARVGSLNLIEAAMRHLRAVTVGRLREKPAVLAVRVGTCGLRVLLNRPVQAPEGWQAASGGYVLELPPGVAVEDLDATAKDPTLCPALVPVGDTPEGPLLLNVEEIGCLIVSGPGSPSVKLLNAVVGTLGSSPLGDIRIVTVGLDTPAGLPGWERVHSTSSGSPQLEELLSTAHTEIGASLDVLVVGPGNDLLIQRAGQLVTTPGSRLALVGATSSVAARWPWRIHVDETATAVVHPIACTMAAAQAMAPAMSQLLSEATDPSLLAPPRF